MENGQFKKLLIQDNISINKIWPNLIFHFKGWQRELSQLKTLWPQAAHLYPNTFSYNITHISTKKPWKERTERDSWHRSTEFSLIYKSKQTGEWNNFYASRKNYVIWLQQQELIFVLITIAASKTDAAGRRKNIIKITKKIYPNSSPGMF